MPLPPWLSWFQSSGDSRPEYVLIPTRLTTVDNMGTYSDIEDHGHDESPTTKSSPDAERRASNLPIGRENLSGALPPHESYEGRHRWDPSATWSESEERRVVWKTDLYLLSWLCLMVRLGVPLCLRTSITDIDKVPGSAIGSRQSAKCFDRQSPRGSQSHHQ